MIKNTAGDERIMKGIRIKLWAKAVVFLGD
jgi:hypothetical protein